MSSNEYTFDKVKISTSTTHNCLLAVGDGDSLLCVDSDGVGIGVLPGSYKLNVNGNTNSMEM